MIRENIKIFTLGHNSNIERRFRTVTSRLVTICMLIGVSTTVIPQAYKQPRFLHKITHNKFSRALQLTETISRPSAREENKRRAHSLVRSSKSHHTHTKTPQKLEEARIARRYCSANSSSCTNSSSSKLQNLQRLYSRFQLEQRGVVALYQLWLAVQYLQRDTHHSHALQLGAQPNQYLRQECTKSSASCTASQILLQIHQLSLDQCPETWT